MSRNFWSSSSLVRANLAAHVRDFGAYITIRHWSQGLGGMWGVDVKRAVISSMKGPNNILVLPKLKSFCLQV